jgi:hypothetical protein
MARNEEKNLSELNRLWLAKQQELESTKETRPPLWTLSSANEIRRWIPSLKREMFFCIRHLSGIRNYPQYKIKEFQERLERLRGEYKKWVRRCLELEPNQLVVPGEPFDHYIPKNRLSSNSFHSNEFAEIKVLEDSFLEKNRKENSSLNSKEPTRFLEKRSIEEIIETPLLENEKCTPISPSTSKKSRISTIEDEDPNSSQNFPLQFQYNNENCAQIDENAKALEMLADYTSESDEESN